MPATSPLDIFHRQILPFLKAESVYRHVRFSGVKGRFLRGQCPFGGETDESSSFWVDMHTLRWSCLAHCGCGGRSPLAFLNGGDFPQPGSGELAAVLARAAALGPSSERVDSLLETFFLLTHALLLNSVERPESKSLCADLRALGFRVGDLPRLPLGLVADGEVLREGLRESGFTESEIDASELVSDARLIGRIVGPIRAADRRLVSFWALGPDGRSPEFLYKGKWKDAIGFFGLDVALSANRRREHLFVVDRIPDAVLFHSLGVHNTAASGGPWRRVPRKRWQLLQHESLTHITLVLDEPGPPDAALVDDLAAFYDSLSPLEVYVLPKAELGELGLLHGFADSGRIGQVAAVMTAEATHALAYCAQQILELYRPRSGWNDASRHQAWKHAIEVCAVLAADHADTLEEHLVPVIMAGLGRTWDDFQPIDEDGPGAAEPPPAEPLGVAPPVVQASGPTEPPQAKRTGRRPTRPAGRCPLHQCDPTECFCFD
jgi:hypothetical protein